MARGFSGTGSTNYLGVSDPDNAFDPNATSWTLSCWVYMNANASGSSVILAHWNGSAGWVLVVVSGGTTVRFSEEGTNMDTASGIGTGSWKHLAVTKDGNQGSFFVDGVVSNTAILPAFVNRTLSFYWGHRDSGATVPINGSIARVCGWRTVALTAAEIAALAKGASPMLVRPADCSWYEGWGVGAAGEPDLRPYDDITPRNLTQTGTVIVTNHAPVCPPFPQAA